MNYEIIYHFKIPQKIIIIFCLQINSSFFKFITPYKISIKKAGYFILKNYTYYHDISKHTLKKLKFQKMENSPSAGLDFNTTPKAESDDKHLED